MTADAAAERAVDEGCAAALLRIVKLAMECAPGHLAVGDVAHAAAAARMLLPEFLQALSVT